MTIVPIAPRSTFSITVGTYGVRFGPLSSHFIQMKNKRPRISVPNTFPNRTHRSKLSLIPEKMPPSPTQIDKI